MPASMFELGTDGPLQILVGVDGSGTSIRAASYAVGVARRERAHLIVLYVLVAAPAMVGAPEASAAFLAGQDEYCQELRRTAVEAEQRYGVTIELVFRRGNPYRELVQVAHERRVDAVIVGASTQAGHRFVGSLAGRLVRDAAWPVTVVP
jgi:nucleotide-binding universal stress UspA family protein